MPEPSQWTALDKADKLLGSASDTTSASQGGDDDARSHSEHSSGGSGRSSSEDDQEESSDDEDMAMLARQLGKSQRQLEKRQLDSANADNAQVCIALLKRRVPY